MEQQAFEVGKSYATRSVCDHNCIFSITVARRTAKTITTTEGKRLGIRPLSYGVAHESVMPYGRYSMAPIIDASEQVAA